VSKEGVLANYYFHRDGVFEASKNVIKKYYTYLHKRHPQMYNLSTLYMLICLSGLSSLNALQLKALSELCSRSSWVA